MRCKHCGEYVDSKYYPTHIRGFCKDPKNAVGVGFSFKEFIKWKPRLLLAWVVALATYLILGIGLLTR